MYGNQSAPRASDVATTDDGHTEYRATRNRSAERECSRVEIEKTTNGGFTVRKYYKATNTSKSDMGYAEPELHAFSSFPELDAFLNETLNDQPDPAGAPPPGGPDLGMG